MHDMLVHHSLMVGTSVSDPPVSPSTDHQWLQWVRLGNSAEGHHGDLLSPSGDPTNKNRQGLDTAQAHKSCTQLAQLRRDHHSSCMHPGTLYCHQEPASLDRHRPCRPPMALKLLRGMAIASTWLVAYPVQVPDHSHMCTEVIKIVTVCVIPVPKV